MAFTTKAIRPANIVRTSLKDWMRGTVTAFDDGRTPVDGLRSSGNVILDQDGTVRPRPSLIPYGTQPPGPVLGSIEEFVVAGATYNSNYLVAMCLVGGVAQPYVSKDGGSWQLCSGKTYNTTAAAHFLQIDDKLLIMNGQDNLSFLDLTTVGSTYAITTFTSLGPPTGGTAAKTGLAGTTLTYYYKISYNSTFGQTASTADVTIQVDRPRNQWDTTANYVTLSWTAPAGAPSNATANVYVGTAAGQEFLIASGLNGTSYKDTGTAPQDSTRIAPTFDNTTGPAVTRGWVINGQVFLTGDKNHPRYVWYGGTGQAVLDFSVLNGGGWVEIGRGTKQFPVRVVPFRDHAGNDVPVVLCQGTNGQGKRYTMTPSTITYGSTILNYFNIQEDNGQAGTDSPDGVLVYNDNIWYPSKDGFKTTGTKPQALNILSTDTITDTIRNDVLGLNTAYMGQCVGLAWQQRIYWALPNGSSTNNEIWILDLQRGGAWMKPWSIPAQWMVLYNSNVPANGGDGNTHFLIYSNGTLYELSYASATNDNGTAFSTNVTSGIVKFSDDGLDWAHLIDVTFIFLRPQGQINLLVTGKTEDAQIAPLGQSNLVPSATVAGWGEAGWGGSPDTSGLLISPEIFGWSNFSVVPTVIGSARYPIVIDVDEDVNYFSWEIDTNTTGVDYQLSDVIGRYVLIGTKDLS